MIERTTQCHREASLGISDRDLSLLSMRLGHAFESMKRTNKERKRKNKEREKGKFKREGEG